jgi:enoyl-CoA hydratase
LYHGSRWATGEDRHVTVTVERDEGVLTAVFDDGKANALTFTAIAELRSALGMAVDLNRALVLTGRRGYFCAGFDLKIMRSGDPRHVASLTSQGFVLFGEMLSAPIPIVAACTGHALAAGALLLLATDYRVGQPGTYQVGLNETRIGIALPQQAIDMATFRLSTNHLTAATLFATVVAPEQACAVGYLDRIDADPRGAALAAATDIAPANLRAFAKTKERMNADIVRRLKGALPDQEES